MPQINPIIRGSIFATLVLVLATVTGACATFTESFETPELSLVSISLRQASMLQQDYRVMAKVMNPNGVRLPIRAVRYTIALAGREFASGATPERFSVPANGETEFAIDVSTDLLSSLSWLAGFFDTSPDELEYDVTGEVEVDLPFVSPFPFTSNGSIPLVRN